MTPEQLAKNGSEAGNQAALFCQFALHFDQYPELKTAFAIPNGGKRDLREAANMKAQGVKAGVYDVFIPVPRGPWHGLFVEMKRAKSQRGRAGKVSDEQNWFGTAMHEAGYGAVECWSWTEAWNCVVSYLEWKG